jgi:hypothetical protein
MKTRIILLIAVSAIATLSFTFAVNSTADNKVAAKEDVKAPVGGLASDEIR